MKRQSTVLVGVILLFCISGCSEIDIPTPGTILRKPLGTDAVKVGMTKNHVKDLWGDPNDISFEGSGSAKWEREVWTYTGRYSAIPVDAGYLSKTKYVYFDGNNVTRVSGTK